MTNHYRRVLILPLIALLIVSVIQFVITPSNAISYNQNATLTIVYGSTHYGGVFDGQAGILNGGEPDETTVNPYTTLEVRGDGSQPIDGGTYQNIDNLHFVNKTIDSYTYLTYSAGNISNVKNLYVHGLGLSFTPSFTVLKIKNVDNIVFPEYSATNPATSAVIGFTYTGVSNKQIISIDNSTLTLPYPINLASKNFALYINNSVINIPTYYGGSSLFFVDTSTGTITTGFEDSKVYLKNVVINIEYTGEIDSLLYLENIDNVYIDNVAFNLPSNTHILKNFINVNNIYDGTIKNCNVSGMKGAGITIGAVYNELHIYNNNFHDADFSDVEKVSIGINCDESKVSPTFPSSLPTGKIYVHDNIISNMQIGIRMSLVPAEIYNNSIADLNKNPANQYECIGIVLAYLDTSVVSYINQVKHTVRYNRLDNTYIGISASLSSVITYNSITNCHNSLIAVPSVYNNYDGFNVYAPYNYFGTDYPKINQINSADPLKALTGEYSGDIIDCSPSYEFTFTYEPFALIKHNNRNDTFSISLNIGWNLIYLPYNLPPNFMVRDLFALSPYLKGVVIREGDTEANYIYFSANVPEGSMFNNYILHGTQGIFVYASNAITIKVPIYSTKVVYNFHRGWNLLGYIISGYTLSSWIERMDAITAIVYRNSDGQYVPLFIHHPLETMERNQINALSSSQGIYVYFDRDIQYTIEPPIYDPATHTFSTSNPT